VNPVQCSKLNRRRDRAVIVLVLALVLPGLALAACSQGDDDGYQGDTSDAGAPNAGNGGGSSGSGAGTGAGAGAGASGSGNAGSDAAKTDAFGSFTIEYKEELAGEAAHTTVSGQLFDAATAAVSSKLDSESGDCKLLVPDFPACGACDDGVCVADGDCQPHPKPIDAGEVVVEGTLGGDVTLRRNGRTFFYQTTSALAYPPCEEGADVTVTGGVSGAEFEATAKCVAPLALITPEPIAVKSGSAVPLAWMPPRDASDSRIAIKLDISHHGGKKGEILCDVPDTGSFELPEPLVSKLVSLGVAAQPTIGLKRLATAQASGQPGVELVIVSPVERAVDTGFVACVEGAACPDGTTCDTNTKVCR
jgi:hypothetical protein